MDIVESVRALAKKALDRNRGSHDWEHTERVCTLALRIAEKEGADLFVVRLAALLHDIARHEEDASGGKTCHAVTGARAARDILAGFGLDADTIERIAHCIESHRYRSGREPATLEAQVLFDADKLDSIGAVGVGRAFLFAGEVGAGLHNKDVEIAHTRAYSAEDTAFREYSLKLRFIKDKMRTPEGRRLAAFRHEYMVGFFERLDREVEGTL